MKEFCTRSSNIRMHLMMQICGIVKQYFVPTGFFFVQQVEAVLSKSISWCVLPKQICNFFVYSRHQINIIWLKCTLMRADARAQLVDMLHFCDAMCAIFSVRLDEAIFFIYFGDNYANWDHSLYLLKVQQWKCLLADYVLLLPHVPPLLVCPWSRGIVILHQAIIPARE